MEFSKAIFIVLKDVSDKDMNPDHESALMQIERWLKNKKQNPLIITSLVNECLQMAVKIGANLGMQYCIYREFANTDTLRNYQNINQLQELDYRPDNDDLNVHIHELIKFIHSSQMTPVFVIDKELFDSFQIQARKRTEKNVIMYEYDIAQKEKINLKNSRILPKEKASSFRRDLRNEIVNSIDDFSSKIERSLRKAKDWLGVTENTAGEIKKIIEVPKETRRNYEGKLKVIESVFERSEEYLSSLSDTLNQIEEFNSNQNIESPSDVIVITGFVSISENYWQLKVKNVSDQKIFNVSVFCLESNTVVHTFKVIEGKSKVFLNVFYQLQNPFNTHFRAFSKCSAVSDIYKYYPYQITLVSEKEDEINIKVLKNLDIEIGPVLITHSSSRYPQPLTRDLKKFEKSIETIKRQPAKKTAIFLISNQYQVSNLLQLEIAN